jgi:group I intron endonuclease
MKPYKVYEIINKINGHNYIGYTKLSLDERFKLHKTAKTIRMPIVLAIKKYGVDNFVIRLCAEFDTKQEAVDYEIAKIAELKPTYNVHSGGTGGPMYGPMNGMFGKKHSQEWKDRKKISMTGEKNPMFNKTHSDDTKKLLSVLKQGNIPWNKGLSGMYSEETLSKMKRPKTEEHKNNLKKTYQFVSPVGELISVTGLTQFCLENELNKGAMSELWSGKRKIYKGWTK